MSVRFGDPGPEKAGIGTATRRAASGTRLMSEDDKILIRQIQEEVRRERYLKLWQQYGAYLVGTVALIVALIGGWQWYTAYQLDRAQTAGAQFSEALDRLEAAQKDEGRKALEQIASEGSPAYALLAKLRLAGEHRAAGEADKALALYEDVAKASAADRFLKSFAELQIASLKLETADWTELENRLKPLIEADAPWRFTAREMLGLAAYKHQKWAEAREAYSTLLTAEGVPGALRQRAQLALAMIAREEDAGASNSDGAGAKKDTGDANGADGALKKAKSTDEPDAAASGAGTGDTSAGNAGAGNAGAGTGDAAGTPGAGQGMNGAEPASRDGPAATPAPGEGAGGTNDAETGK